MSTETDVLIIGRLNELADQIGELERRPVPLVTQDRLAMGGPNNSIVTVSNFGVDPSIGLIAIPRFYTSVSLAIQYTPYWNPPYALTLGVDSAAKPGSSAWTVISDERTKDPASIRSYTAGLAELRRMRPIVFKYNGKGGTPRDGREYTGLIAQEVEKIAPDMIRRALSKLNPDDDHATDLLAVDNNDLPYMLINAVAELDESRKGHNARAGRVDNEVQQLQTKTAEQASTIAAQAQQIAALQRTIDQQAGQITAIQARLGLLPGIGGNR